MKLSTQTCRRFASKKEHPCWIFSLLPRAILCQKIRLGKKKKYATIIAYGIRTPNATNVRADLRSGPFHNGNVLKPRYYTFTIGRWPKKNARIRSYNSEMGQCHRKSIFLFVRSVLIPFTPFFFLFFAR